MSEEIWKDLEIDFTCDYEISSYGRIHRKNSKQIATGSGGKITLSNHGKTKSFSIDELVLKQFSVYDENVIIRHLDGNKENCALDNLSQEDPVEDLEGEEWRHPDCLEERYLVSNLGRVKNTKELVLCNVRNSGDNCVNVVSAYGTDMIHKDYRVEELVADCFLNRSAFQVVTHINGDLHDDRACNLTLSIDPPCEEGEIWKPVKGYETRYMVSSHGRVFTIPQKIKRGEELLTFKGGILNGSDDYTDGYIKVALVNLEGNRKDTPVHRIIAETFLQHDESHNQVNHIDGNKKNNRIENLEWVTNLENIQHARRTGLYINAVRNSPLTIPVCDNKGHNFESIAEAARFYHVADESLRLYIHGNSSYCKGLPIDVTFHYSEKLGKILSIGDQLSDPKSPRSLRKDK